MHITRRPGSAVVIVRTLESAHGVGSASAPSHLVRVCAPAGRPRIGGHARGDQFLRDGVVDGQALCAARAVREASTPCCRRHCRRRSPLSRRRRGNNGHRRVGARRRHRRIRAVDPVAAAASAASARPASTAALAAYATRQAHASMASTPAIDAATAAASRSGRVDTPSHTAAAIA